MKSSRKSQFSKLTGGHNSSLIVLPDTPRDEHMIGQTSAEEVSKLLSKKRNSFLTNMMGIWNLAKASTCRTIVGADCEVTDLLSSLPSPFHMRRNAIVLSLLRDTSYQLFQASNFFRGEALDRARCMVRMGVRDFPGDELTFAQAWPYLSAYMVQRFREFYEYTLRLPGVDRVDARDVCAQLSHVYIILNGIFTTRLFVNEQSFIFLPGGIQLTRRLIEGLCNRTNTDHVFQFHARLAELNVTDSELALLTPLVLTMKTGYYIHE
jgi:hypothetical protein